MFNGECEPWNYRYVEYDDDHIEIWLPDPAGRPSTKISEHSFSSGSFPHWLPNVAGSFHHSPYYCLDCHTWFRTGDEMLAHGWPYKEPDGKQPRSRWRW